MTPEENVAAVAPEDAHRPSNTTPVELPPFSPPPNFQFEEELRGPVPRPIPSFVRQGRTMRRSLSNLKLLFYIGGISLVFAHTPIVKFLGQFILPLQYLDYFGYGLVGIGSILCVSHFLRPGVLQYISKGIPLPVRIRDLRLVPEAEMHGVVLRSAYVAVIESLNPETGGIAQINVRSTSLSIDEIARITTNFAVGDYATAVYLPGKFQKSLRLYGFLELNPEVGIVQRENLPKRPFHSTPFGGTLICVGCISAALAVAYIVARYFPLDVSAWGIVASVAAGILFAGPAFYLLMNPLYGKEGNKPVDPARPMSFGTDLSDPRHVRLIHRIGAGLFGAIFGLVLAILANSLLDRSPMVPRPVVIHELKMTTYNHVFRMYNIEYSFADNLQEVQRFSTTPDHALQFMGQRGKLAGIAETHAGFLGWGWVRTIRPAAPEQAIRPKRAPDKPAKL